MFDSVDCTLSFLVSTLSPNWLKLLDLPLSFSFFYAQIWKTCWTYTPCYFFNLRLKFDKIALVICSVLGPKTGLKCWILTLQEILQMTKYWLTVTHSIGLLDLSGPVVPETKYGWNLPYWHLEGCRV